MFRPLAFLTLGILALSAPACSGDDEAEEGCTAANGVTFGFGTAAPCIDIGNFFSGTATCLATGEFDTSACTGQDVLPEYQLCELGSEPCEEGTECVTFIADASGNLGVCAEACDTANDTCGTGRVCSPLPGYEDVSVCLEQSGIRNSLCGLADTRYLPPAGVACADGLVCELSARILPIGECKDRCAVEEIGTTGSCGGGDSCFGRLQVQADENGPVECDTIGSSTGCADGFTCGSFGGLASEGDDFTFGPQGLCSRQEPFCGTAAPFVSDFTLEALQALEPSDFCDRPRLDGWCPAELQAGATAEIECTFTRAIATTDGGDVPCGDDLDCPEGFGLFCDRGRCVEPLRGCVPFCEDAAGTMSFDCGEGFTCQPAQVQDDARLDTIFETESSGALVECPNGDECGTDFDCAPVSIGTATGTVTLSACVRDRRVCVPDPEPAP